MWGLEWRWGGWWEATVCPGRAVAGSGLPVQVAAQVGHTGGTWNDWSQLAWKAVPRVQRAGHRVAELLELVSAQTVSVLSPAASVHPRLQTNVRLPVAAGG